MNENSSNKQTKLTFSDIDLAKQLFGEHNGNLHIIAKAIAPRSTQEAAPLLFRATALQRTWPKTYSTSFTVF